MNHDYCRWSSIIVPFTLEQPNNHARWSCLIDHSLEAAQYLVTVGAASSIIPFEGA